MLTTTSTLRARTSSSTCGGPTGSGNGSTRCRWPADVMTVAGREPGPRSNIPSDCEHLAPSTAGRAPRVAVHSLETGEVTPLTDAVEASSPATSGGRGDGSQIAFQRFSTSAACAVRPTGSWPCRADGTEERTLADARTARQSRSSALDGVLVGAAGETLTRYVLETGAAVAELPGARGEIDTLQFTTTADAARDVHDLTASLYDVGDAASGSRTPSRRTRLFLFPAFLRHDGTGLAVTTARGVAVLYLDPARMHEDRLHAGWANLSAREREHAPAGPGSATSRAPARTSDAPRCL